MERRDGTWTFLDPRGQKFFSLGINAVNPAEDEEVKAPKYDGLSRHGGSRKKWRSFTLKRLQSWNFNTIGAWSSLRGQPYVLELSLSYSWMDVFDDGFATYVQKAARDVLQRPDVAGDYVALDIDYAALDRDPLLIGYFTDNELAWGWDYGWSGKEDDLSLFEYYATLKPEAAGKKAWATYLAGAYAADFAKLRRVWDVNSNSLDDLQQVKQIAPRGPEQHKEAARVADGFLRKIAESYFEVTSRVMRKHLPHHLNLGVRLTPRFPAVVAETAGRYADVLSFNAYTRDFDFLQNELARLHQAGKKPVLLTEFAFPARQNRTGNKNKGYEQVEVADDAERGREYARCVARLSELPYVVGCHWFQYHDEPPQGRLDGESCNFGFVDLTDRVYDDLAQAASGANALALKRRGAALPAAR